jgi:hypothetical protein
VDGAKRPRPQLHRSHTTHKQATEAFLNPLKTQKRHKYTALRHGCTRFYSTCAQLITKRSPIPRPYEATEAEIVQDADLAREVATQLTVHNISLSIDDFGSSYSSFSQLRDLSAGELKIDDALY